jgi:hypothetical protein
VGVGVGWVGYYFSGLLPREELHDRCAGASGEVGLPASKWSAVISFLSVNAWPHRWQWVAVALIKAAARLYVCDV